MVKNVTAVLIEKAKQLPETEAIKVIIFINGLEAGQKLSETIKSA